MSDNIEYGKQYTTDNYYNGEKTGTKVENEVSQFSTPENILKDYIESFKVMSEKQTHKLVVEVCIDNKGRYRLVRRWSVDV